MAFTPFWLSGASCRHARASIACKLTDLILPISFRRAYEWAGFADLRIGTWLACGPHRGGVGPRLCTWQSG